MKNKFREISCKAFDRFENESQSNNAKVLKNLKQNLTSDLDKIYASIRSENERLKNQYQEYCKKSGKQSEEKVLSVYMSDRTIYGAIFDNKIHNVFFTMSPNCVAIDEEVVVGKWAKELLNNSKDFDIKKLFVSRIEDLSAKLLNAYPFEFISVNSIPKANFKNCCVTIESLIVTQVLDIKSKAEKEISTLITKGIFVIPHQYIKGDKGKFEKLSIIAGLESVQVMSEMTCAAIGFCHEQNGGGIRLFVAINDMTYDAAVIEMGEKSVKYLNYVKRKLEDYETKTESQSPNTENYNRMEGLINHDINNVFPANNPLRVESIIIIGTSNEMDFIINQFYKYRPNIGVKADNCGHLVSKGAAIYAKFAIEDNEEFRYNINEIIQ